MKERPILFSGPMVRALLDGRKTQTRRVAKTFAPIEYNPHDDREYVLWNAAKTIARVPARNHHDEADLRMACPYGGPGDRLWVRERIHRVGDRSDPICASIYDADGAITKADAWPWKADHLPSIHCPRGLSRITLEVTSVRVERVQSISEEDAIAEGIPTDGCGAALNWNPAHDFRDLWDSINGKRPGCSWDANPWVWIVEFKAIDAEWDWGKA